MNDNNNNKNNDGFTGYICALIILIVGVPLLFYIFICLFVENKFPHWSTLNTDQWVNVFNGIMGLFGSVSIGLLAIYQNKNFQKRNDELQIQMQIIDDKLLNLENMKIKPQIGISLNKYIKQNVLFAVDLNIHNIGEFAVKNICLYNIELQYDDILCQIPDKNIQYIAPTLNHNLLLLTSIDDNDDTHICNNLDIKFILSCLDISNSKYLYEYILKFIFINGVGFAEKQIVINELKNK